MFTDSNKWVWDIDCGTLFFCRTLHDQIDLDQEFLNLEETEAAAEAAEKAALKAGLPPPPPPPQPPPLSLYLKDSVIVDQLTFINMKTLCEALYKLHKLDTNKDARNLFYQQYLRNGRTARQVMEATPSVSEEIANTMRTILDPEPTTKTVVWKACLQQVDKLLILCDRMENLYVMALLMKLIVFVAHTCSTPQEFVGMFEDDRWRKDQYEMKRNMREFTPVERRALNLRQAFLSPGTAFCRPVDVLNVFPPQDVPKPSLHAKPDSTTSSIKPPKLPESELPREEEEDEEEGESLGSEDHDMEDADEDVEFEQNEVIEVTDENGNQILVPAATQADVGIVHDGDEEEDEEDDFEPIEDDVEEEDEEEEEDDAEEEEEEEEETPRQNKKKRV